MITKCSFTSASNYVELAWESPPHQPARYELTYLCIITSTCLRKSDLVVFPDTRFLKLSSESTFISISDLRPDSLCVLKLLAFYNSASIDPGMVITFKTLAANTSKWTLKSYDPKKLPYYSLVLFTAYDTEIVP